MIGFNRSMDPTRRPGRLRRAFAPLLLIAAIAALASTPVVLADAQRIARPNLILITLDTTRADHLGVYGYEPATSPELDAFARDAVVYTRAYSTSSWTLPAHASLFTGKFPRSHGALYDPKGPMALADGIQAPRGARNVRASPLAEGQVTLAQILSKAGYDTGAVVAGPWMKRVFGLDRGFAAYDDEQIHTVSGRLASQVTKAASTWLEGAKPPFFLFLNYYDPHWPYEDPEGLARQFLPPETPVFPPPQNPTVAELNGYYDGEVRYMDRHLGRFFDRLREAGLYDDALILITADHGDLLGEHGQQGHGYYLYEPEIHIPLLIKYPRGEVKPARIDRPVQLTDLLPLLAQRLDLPLPEGVQGASPPGDGPIFAEVYPLGRTRYRGDWRAYLQDGFKFLWNSRGEHELYHLEKDPGETSNLSEGDPQRVARMIAALDAFFASLPEAKVAEVPEVDAETRRALENLGYLD